MYINNYMFYNYNGTSIFYEQKRDSEGGTNVFLHGWQRSGEDFREIIESQGITNYVLLDFPPFGKSDVIKGWNIFTYVNMLISLLDYLKIKRVNLIGHSFGGRIAIILAAIKRDFVGRLVLLDSAGMKPKKTFRKFVKIQSYKLRKKLGLNVDGFGSSDYRALSKEMRETFKSVVNTYLEEYAKQISCQTLIIYGENDKETPIYMAKKLNKLIDKSRLEVIKNSGHFCFVDNKIKVGKMIGSFLKEE